MYMYSIHTACILVMFADASRARVQVGRIDKLPPLELPYDASRARVQVGSLKSKERTYFDVDASRARVQVGRKIC